MSEEKPINLKNISELNMFLTLNKPIYECHNDGVLRDLYYYWLTDLYQRILYTRGLDGFIWLTNLDSYIRMKAQFPYELHNPKMEYMGVPVVIAPVPRGTSKTSMGDIDRAIGNVYLVNVTEKLIAVLSDLQ